jgi:hypothetical protein
MSDDENAPPSEIVETPTIAEVEKPADAPAPEAKEGEDQDKAETAADASKPGEGDAEDNSPKKPNRTSAKERIAELTRQKHEAQQRAAQAEAKLKAYEQPAPKRADFGDDDDAYQTERAKWAAKAARGDEAKHEADSAKTEADAAKAEAWSAQRAEISERHPDFDETIKAVPPSIFTEAVANAILESEMAADVAYVLAKDLTRAKKFAALPPLQQGREIGRIESEIAASTPKPRKISSAPPPIETVGTKGPGSGFNPASASVADIAKHLGLKG